MQAPLGFLLQTLGQLVQDVARLVNPAALLAGAWVDLAERLPEAERAVAERQLRTHFKAAPLEIEQNFEPGLLTFAIAVGDGDQFLLSLVRGPDDHQDALLLFLHAGAEIDAVHPEIDVALGREVAPLPALRLNPPDLFQPGDRGGRKPRRGAPQERRQGFPEVAGGNALQIQPWQKVFQALGAAQIARQDRRREADGAVPPVPHTGLAHAHRADPGLDEAFRQISIADNPAAAGGVNKRRMATQKHGDLGLNGLGQQLASSSL